MRVVVLTGAGISAESGVPTFRDAGGLWEGHRLEDVATPEAYERLLLDVMIGDASLFMRRDAVEASWAWINLILDTWKEEKTGWLPEYPAGTWGPAEADRLIQADGRAWRTM